MSDSYVYEEYFYLGNFMLFSEGFILSQKLNTETNKYKHVLPQLKKKLSCLGQTLCKITTKLTVAAPLLYCYVITMKRCLRQ